MRGYSDVGNLTNINRVVETANGFKGVFAIAGAGRRETAVFGNKADAESALNALRPAGFDKDSLNY